VPSGYLVYPSGRGRFAIANSASSSDTLRRTTNFLVVRVRGVAANVLWSGLTPQFAAVNQITACRLKLSHFRLRQSLRLWGGPERAPISPPRERQYKTIEQRIGILTLGVADLDRSGSFYERRGSNGRQQASTLSSSSSKPAARPWRCIREPNWRRRPHRGGRPRLCRSGNRLQCPQPERGRCGPCRGGSGWRYLLKPAQEAFWVGYSGYFADPDNFPWEVAWNPSFPIAEDGSIGLPV
jgi:uncharacterized protein